jgi:hypothetical protein
MKRTFDWLKAEHQRALRRPTLDLALLTESATPYAAARLGLPAARMLLRTLTHTAELWFLARQFPFEFLAPLFALRALPGLLTGLHWGALEGLRASVRADVRRGAAQAATAAIEAHLAAATLIAFSIAAAITALVVQIDDPIEGPLGLYGSFAIVVACTSAAEIATRTHHAGAYALGRVYRPPWTFVLTDTIELLGVLLLWGVFGTFALHLVVLAGSGARCAIALVYSRRMYRQRRVPLPRLRVRALARLRPAELGSALVHALAAVPLQLDRALLIALLAAPAPSTALPLAMPFYALRPVLGFAQSWSRGFYTDFVRLDGAGLGLLRVRFERFLARVGLACGALACAALLAASLALFGTPGLGAALWLTPLVLARAHSSGALLQSFVYGSHRGLLLAGFALLAGLCAAVALRASDRTTAVVITAAWGVATLSATRAAGRARRDRKLRPRKLALAGWLHGLTQHEAQLCLFAARVDRAIATPGALLHVVVRELERRGMPGHVARLGTARIVWWEAAGEEKAIERWAPVLGGVVAELRCVPGERGSEALERALEADVLGGELVEALRAPQPSALEELAAQLVPGVQTIDLQRADHSVRSLAPHELPQLRRAVLAASRERTVRAHDAQRVVVYAPAAEPRIVFVCPERTPSVAALRRAMLHASWRASVELSHARKGA